MDYITDFEENEVLLLQHCWFPLKCHCIPYKVKIEGFCEPRLNATCE